ncbi:unnamed protein product [Rhodiola kirilowii]
MFGNEYNIIHVLPSPLKLPNITSPLVTRLRLRRWGSERYLPPSSPKFVHWFY